MVVENFSKGFQLATRVYYLAILPFILDLIFLTGREINTFSANVVRFGIKFSFPDHFPSLTDFFNFPTTTGIQTSLLLFSDVLILALLSFVVSTILVSFVSAGYLGKMNSIRKGEPSSFLNQASKYFARILAYGVVLLLLILIGTPFVLTSLALGFLYVIGFFVIYYFIFLTPFGIVVDNLAFEEALRRSINLATSRASKTLPYVIVYLILTALISIPIYGLMNAGFPGFLISLVISALVGTVLVASTLHLYVQLTEPTTPPITLTPPPPNSPNLQPPQ